MTSPDSFQQVDADLTASVPKISPEGAGLAALSFLGRLVHLLAVREAKEQAQAAPDLQGGQRPKVTGNSASGGENKECRSVTAPQPVEEAPQPQGRLATHDEAEACLADQAEVESVVEEAPQPQASKPISVEEWELLTICMARATGYAQGLTAGKAQALTERDAKWEAWARKILPDLMDEFSEGEFSEAARQRATDFIMASSPSSGGTDE